MHNAEKKLTVACIFARSGSKGLPEKNIKNFNGKPLIEWTIETAFKVSQIDQLYVSTDSIEIAKIAESKGVNVPFIRPSDLATDESPEWLSWQHFIDYLVNFKKINLGSFVSLPTTSPLRIENDIERCINEFKKGESDFVIGITPSKKNPYFNMVRKGESNFLHMLIENRKRFTRRQDTPKIFDITTVCYVGKPEFILKHNSLFEGKVVGVEIPIERAIDIDDQLDFSVAQFLHSNRGAIR